MSSESAVLTRPEDAVLIVVDVQGKLARLVQDSEAMIIAQQRLIRACRMLDVPVVWAEQLPDKLGSTVDELVGPLDGLSACAKSSFGCMGDPALRDAIAGTGRSQALLCGIETHVCVWQTAARLLHEGFGVQVIADATSSRSRADKDIALRRMECAGAALSSVEMLVFELMVDAAHPRFREITRLFK